MIILQSRERIYVAQRSDGCACSRCAAVQRFEAETLLTITQGGVHRGAPSPCAATPPRLALSGALVLNAGCEHNKLPAALWAACTLPCYMEPKGGSPRMKQLKVQRALLEGPHRGWL